MRVVGRVAPLFLFFLLFPSSVFAQASFGQFKGDVVAKFLSDGRNMQLEQPFGYVDPRGQHWDVPAGAQTDGASIPRVLWLSHPPFTGKYRAAAVIHDHYCQNKSRSWKETHEVFYHAMRAAGVEDRTAKVMYGAVYYFGPRWGQGDPRAAGAARNLPLEEETKLFNDLKAWIETESPDIDAITRRLDAGLGPVQAGERRIALVIGNSAYQHTAKLENTKTDATDMAAALEQLGFRVTKGIDLGKAGMDRTIRQFARALAGADVGLFFYAGHGLQVGGQNYLVPIDAKLEDATGLDFEMVRLELVHKTMERETRTNVIFLDACRDNPLARNLARAMGTRSAEIGRGLAAVESGVGTLISFSTQPGNVALDGAGRNSPFAGALVKHLQAPKEDLSSILINVRNDVMQVTRNRQIPWEHSALRAKFYFAGLPEAPKLVTPPSTHTFEQQAELAFWNAVKDSTNSAVIQTYVDAYPKGMFTPLARVLVEQLKRNDEQKAALALREAELRKAEEAKRAAEAREAEAARKAAEAKQAEELKRTQAEAQKARVALVKAEKERDAALKAAEQQREAARKSAAEAARVQDETKHKTVEAEASQPTEMAVLPTPEAPKTSVADPEMLTRDLKRELKRVGCDPGPIDGKWGGKAKEALMEFTKRTKLAFTTDESSVAALEAVSTRKGRLCPLICADTEVEAKGECVAKPASKPSKPLTQETKPQRATRTNQLQERPAPTAEANPNIGKSQKLCFMGQSRGGGVGRVELCE